MGHFHNTRAHRGPRVQGFRGPQGSKGLPTWLDFQMANIIIEMTPHATHMYIQRMRNPTKAHKAPQQPIRHSAYKTPHARHMYIQRIRQNTCTVFCMYTHATSRTAYIGNSEKGLVPQGVFHNLPMNSISPIPPPCKCLPGSGQLPKNIRAPSFDLLLLSSLGC